MINYLVDTAFRLAPRYGTHGLLVLLLNEFPTVRQDAIRLIVSRLAVAATSSKQAHPVSLPSLRHEVADLINNYELTGDNFPRLQR